MTIVKVFILVVLISIFVFTAYKLVMQIKEFKTKKSSVQKQECSELKSDNTLKEDK